MSNLYNIQYENPELFDKLMEEAETERIEAEMAKKEKENECND